MYKLYVIHLLGSLVLHHAGGIESFSIPSFDVQFFLEKNRIKIDLQH